MHFVITLFYKKRSVNTPSTGLMSDEYEPMEDLPCDVQLVRLKCSRSCEELVQVAIL